MTVVLTFPKSVQAGDLYRFYSESFQGHFYTKSTSERDDVDRNPDWNYEGVAYLVSEPAYDVPVYRFWSENYKHHFFTALIAERDNIIQNDPNWSYEGEVFTVSTVGTPVHRFYSDLYQGHFYTISDTERQVIIENDPNWRYEGIAWYADLSSTVTSPTSSQVDAGIARRESLFAGVDGTVYPGGINSVYQIQFTGGEYVLPDTAPQSDKDLWTMLVDLAPSDEVLASMGEFEVFYDPSQGFSGSVETASTDFNKWRMSINYTNFDHFDFIPALIIHEYAHILTFAGDQTTLVASASDCSGHFDDGTCYLAGSYLDDFYKRFWQGTSADIGRRRTSSEAAAFFAAHPNEFVSQYATTSEDEDFSETLSTYILSDGHDTNLVKGQKIESMKNYVALRDYQLRSRTAIIAW